VIFTPWPHGSGGFLIRSSRIYSMRDWLKNVALFYIIILLMVSVPLVVVFVVLSITTLISLRYWIAGGVFFFICLGVFLVYKNRKQYSKDLRRNKEEVLKILEHAIKSGHDVDISVMGGLLKISYKSKGKELPAPPNKEMPSLPRPSDGDNNNIVQLED